MRIVRVLLFALLLALAGTGVAEATGPMFCPHGMETR